MAVQCSYVPRMWGFVAGSGAALSCLGCAALRARQRLSSPVALLTLFVCEVCHCNGIVVKESSRASLLEWAVQPRLVEP